jgi:GntR family transcriptional regulator/MocR family aminotransferase
MTAAPCCRGRGLCYQEECPRKGHLEEIFLGHIQARPARNTDTLFEIDLQVHEAGSPSQDLFHGLKAAIVDGRLTAGAKLPPARKSATFYGVSRNTAAEVYAKLAYEGLVVTRHGSGTYVAQRVTSFPKIVHRPDATPDSRLSPFWLRPDIQSAMGFWGKRSDPASATSEVPPVEFRPAIVDHRLFPYELLRKVTADQLRGSERKPASFKSAQGNQGNYHLRTAIRSHIARTRAVVCEIDNILVTCGGQQAFDLLARVLVTSNQTVVAMEDPGYPPMRVSFAAAGAKVVPVAVDAEGLMVEKLPSNVNVICACPSHQFPLGLSMSLRRRQSLIEFARQRNAVIVEDDYDGEFRYDGTPLQALRTPDAADVVFYVGTFSKCMLPSLRLGYIVAPDWAMQTLIAAKNSLDWHCATPIQTSVAAFIQGGHLTRHVRRMRGIYKRRRLLVLESVRDQLGEWLTPVPSFYGMHVTAVAHAAVDFERVAVEMRRQNVTIHSLSPYYAGPETRQGFVFGYGTADLNEIGTGIARLRKALRA